VLSKEKTNLHLMVNFKSPELRAAHHNSPSNKHIPVRLSPSGSCVNFL